MNHYNKQDTSVHGQSRFWFGTSLAQFLAKELQDFPGRRVAAVRLFAVTLIIALVSQTLHVPPLGALAILISLSYDAYANAGQSLAFGLRQLFYLIVTVIMSVLTLMLAGNDGWLVLTLSFMIMALALFHARLIAWPTGLRCGIRLQCYITRARPTQTFTKPCGIFPSLAAWACVPGRWCI